MQTCQYHMHRCCAATRRLGVRHNSIGRRRPPPAAAATNGPPEHNYNTNSAYNYLVEDRAAVFDRYALVNARALSQHDRQPRKVKMYTRDFIDDSLYNPSYGYFSKQAVILTPDRDTPFSSFRDDAAFQNYLARTYAAFEDGSVAGGGDSPTAPRQVWQTPTEMFKPHYGQAIARYLITNYKLTHYPYKDLLIYEVGAGNGTLMLNVLDYIRETEPDMYMRTRYKVIEISRQLAAKQRNTIAQVAADRGHADKVEIVNRSVFDWDQHVPEPCFFLAMEVFDNFAHDAVRYDLLTEQPFQALVAVDEAGDYHEILTPVLDPLLRRYLSLRDRTEPRQRNLHPTLRIPRLIRDLRSRLPLAPNLTSPEFIPTKLLEFMQVLIDKFPRHRLLVSDFHSLPDAMDGVNAPVVQTRYRGTMVPCSTYLVYPGYFDIMFPTDFHRLNRMYTALLSSSTSVDTARAGIGAGFFSHTRSARGDDLGEVSSHAEFMTRWADTDATTTKSGENPLLDFYENASFLTT